MFIFINLITFSKNPPKLQNPKNYIVGCKISGRELPPTPQLKM